jgi:acetolactate synthase-1/2/3 large subunit
VDARPAAAGRGKCQGSDEFGGGAGAWRGREVHERIDAQQLTLDQYLLASIRRALPSRAPSFWDMTILASVLAVSRDGGAFYSIAGLAAARQYDLDVTWLIVDDDGGYGILREYMANAFGETTGTELTRSDCVVLAESFGVPGTRTTPETLADDLAKSLASPGPSVVALPAVLSMFAPTRM